MNPYQPPVAQTNKGGKSCTDPASRLPDELIGPTRLGLRALAFLAIVLPLLLSPIVDGFSINPFAIVPLVVGFTTSNRSFKSFPWTSVACLSFVLELLGYCERCTVTEIKNWLPCKASPLLSLRVLCALSGLYTAALIWRCYRYHYRQQNAVLRNRTNNLLQ
ncbi:MAG: hypothetical protein KDB03_02300 [Planctomycetales bacterium]|nr:hypothetical protein [Planctomycetales bacterium]